MGIDLYYLTNSPPSRAVLLAARTIGVELNLKQIDFEAGDNLTDEYLNMNPQHKMPTVDDNGFFMSESRAIIQYFANAYGTDETLYPKDPKARYLVDHRMNFDLGTLYRQFCDTYTPVIFAGIPVDPNNVARLNEALGFLEVFLGKTTYVAGDNLTIADFSFAATLSTIESVEHDLSAFPLVEEYLAMLKEGLDGYDELCQEGADEFGEWYKISLEKITA